MRTDDFWQLISDARAGTGGDPGQVADRLVRALVGRGLPEVVGWQRHLDRVLTASVGADLWGAAYLINSGCSDDDYDSFRGWLMAQGRTVFARAVTEPDSLAELPPVRRAAATGAELTGAAMLGVGDTAHHQLTGAEPGGPGRAAATATDDFWDFDDEDEVRRRLPRLAVLFLEPPEE
ncbi:MAG TPA: DUF4240 domain-containing protein [Micromonospora sp.]